jgi:hypothetical protein
MSPDSPEPSGFSRRDFLLRAGQVSALTLAGPYFSQGLMAAPSREWLAARGVTEEMLAAASPQELALLYSGLHWRLIGPFRGGRTAAATGVHGRPNEFYFGSVNGGVWKSVDAGRVWRPVFDGQPVASIGAIAVSASSPDTVYVGTGESTLRDSVGYGNGVYKSTDAGRTWTHLGLDETHHIGKIAIDPRNPNIVFVAAIGHLYAPNPERGVFRSRDGGRTWQKVLFKNDDVGAVEVVIDPVNPMVVYAGLWNTRRPPWYTYAPTNGPGGGIYKSVDGGTTWKPLTNGLPKEGIGRTGIAVCPTNPRRIYAVVDCLLPEQAAAAARAGEPPIGTPPVTVAPGRAGGAGSAGGAAQAPAAGQGGFYRSDDAGVTWRKMSGDQALWGRGWYFEKVAVDPKNADNVYVSNVSVSRSMDGGQTWVPLRGSPGGDDYHQPWISPDDSNTMVVASDQGAVITRNAKAADPRDVTWSSWLNQPTAQMYHIDVDYRFPYWVHGAQQDSGSVAVRSRGKFAVITMRDWEPIGAGGESGYTAGDPLNPGIIYGGSGSRFNLETNTSVGGTTQPRSPETARTDWTQPLVLSKADPHALYYANQFLFKSTDAAATWKQISGDLTRPDPGVPSNLDAAAAAQTDRNGKRGVIYTIAPSPVAAATVWVGTDDGLIHVSADDGATWKDVTPPGATSWSRVTMMQASHFDANTAYASVDRHQMQDFEPYIYRTRDLGRTWTRITGGLPAGVYVHTIKEDHVRKGLLFAGTERGAFMSMDDGASWQPLQMNLPVTSVRDFVIYNNDLIVGTHGRGIWIIDDMSPLRQIDNTVLGADAFLFKPADAFVVAQGGDNGTPTQKDEPQAENPPNGAYIYYYLRNTPTSPVTLEILNAAGAVVQTFTSAVAGGGGAPGGGGGGGGGGGAQGGGRGGIPNTTALWRTPAEPFSATAGMHRVAWTPGGGGRGRGAGGGGGGAGAPAAQTAGQFAARLTVNGQSYTQTFNIKPDPRR